MQCLRAKELEKQKYSEDSTVKVEVIPPEGCSYKTAEYTFKVNKGKKLFVLDDIDFEMVK